MPGYLPLSPSSKARIRRRYLGASGGNLSGIDRWWGGRRGVAWILSASALQRLVGQPFIAKAATIVNDAAGLGHVPSTELMLIRYPKGFDAFLRVKQPTSFDNDWERPGSFFVSFSKQDGWGRAHSCSGTRPGVPERVHGELKNLTSDYRTEFLGVVEELKLDRSSLMNEGYHRLDSLMAKALVMQA